MAAVGTRKRYAFVSFFSFVCSTCFWLCFCVVIVLKCFVLEKKQTLSPHKDKTICSFCDYFEFFLCVVVVVVAAINIIDFYSNKTNKSTNKQTNQQNSDSKEEQNKTK